jgi:hypothetical protein
MSLINCNVTAFMSFQFLQLAVLVRKVAVPLAKNTFCG